MSKPIEKDNVDSPMLVVEVDAAKSDASLSGSNRRRPPGSQVGRYKRFEKSIPTGAERVIEPTKYDVVFGRGKGSHDHPGNKRMREIICRHKKDYAAIHRSKKRQIAELVYSEITQDGARFLHKIDGEDTFAVVDLNLALQKLSNTLRCRKSCLIEEDDDAQSASSATHSSPSTTASNSPVAAASIGAATAAGIQALRDSLAGQKQLSHGAMMPPLGLGSLHSLQIASLPASDHQFLRQRLFGGLASLAEHELLLRRSSLLGGSSSLLGANSLLLAEQEYLMAQTRLRSAALGL